MDRRNIFIEYDKGSRKEYNFEDLSDFLADFKKIVGRRKTVLLLANNNIATVFTYISCLLSKNVIILLGESSVSDNKIENIIETYRPNFICCAVESNHINIGGKKRLEKYGYILSECFSEEIRVHEKLALLIPTSGSTGKNKMVRISYKNLYANTRDICSYLNITSKDTAITTLPIYYVYGLSIINTHIWRGATVILTKESVLSNEFWEIVEKEKVTSLSGVPFTYELMLRSGLINKGLKALRYLTQAGGKMSVGMQLQFLQWCKDRDVDFYVMYGQSEATARMSYLCVNENETKIGSVGKAIPHGKLYISVEKYTGREAGEIIYEGENVCLGYSCSYLDLEKGDENKGVLHTGDIGVIDKDGYLYIKGREKRFIKLYGERLSLDEIETDICEWTGIEKCICVERNDRLIVHIEEKGVEDKIIGFLKQEYSMRENQMNVKVLKHFPYNEYGKINYSELNGEEVNYEY